MGYRNNYGSSMAENACPYLNLSCHSRGSSSRIQWLYGEVMVSGWHGGHRSRGITRSQWEFPLDCLILILQRLYQHCKQGQCVRIKYNHTITMVYNTDIANDICQ